MVNLNLNKVILAGRLTADPELKTTQGGVSVLTFTVAVDRSYRSSSDQQPQTDFITVVAWRQTAEFVSRYFHKGSSICVLGSIQVRSWTDQNGQKRYATEVVADEVKFVDSKNEGNSPKAPYMPYGGQFDTGKPPAYDQTGLPLQSMPEAPTGDFVGVGDDENLPF